MQSLENEDLQNDYEDLDDHQQYSQLDDNAA